MTANPADAVREALENGIQWMSELHSFRHAHDRDRAYANALARFEDAKRHIAALAGAAPVAWMRRNVTYRAVDGRTDGERVVSERKVYEDDIPLFMHAPAKAREVTDADVERACNAYDTAAFTADDLANPESMRAALATFAEGGE